MSKFAILRVKKIKAAQAVNLSLKHVYRDQDTPNADPSLQGKNSNIVSENRAAALDKFNARLETQNSIRKNGVRAIEYLVTSSPDALSSDSNEKYLTDALDWIKKKHGEENIISAAIHRDEVTTPHLTVHIVPIDDKGKLNCRHFLGERDALSKMQTDFFEKVGRRHGLDRGIEGSKAKHQDVSRYYARVKDVEEKKITVPQFGKVAYNPQPTVDKFAAQMENAWRTARAQAAELLDNEKKRKEELAKKEVEFEIKKNDLIRQEAVKEVNRFLNSFLTQEEFQKAKQRSEEKKRLAKLDREAPTRSSPRR